MTFNSVADLKSYITRSVQSALENEVAQNIRSIEIQMIGSNVYGVYSPVTYPRRQASGGLSDESNIVGTVSGTTLTVRNITSPSSYNEPDECPARSPGNLVQLIEMGDGNGGEYTHKHSRQPSGPTFLAPRPFVQPTIQEVASGRYHISGLQSGLLRAGIPTTIS